MAIPKNPCYGCDKRTATCHCDCEDYEIFKLEMAEYNAIIYEAKKKERAIRDYEIRQRSKRKG